LLFCLYDSGMQGGIPPCIPEVLGTCYSVWMTVWYAGWNSTLHTRSFRYFLFCVDDCLVCRVEFHPPYQKYLVLVILCGWLSGMQGGIPPCIPEVLGTCYSVWMTVWYAGWNSTLHTKSTWYLLFCVDDCLVRRVEFHPAYQKYLVLVILCGWLSGMQGGIPPCIPKVLGTCYYVWMTVWYAGWNSTLHTRSTRYLLFCVDDCMVCRVEFHPAYQTVLHTE